MHGQDPRSLPILERIARWIPGYGGYIDRGNRRSDDQLLRDAIAARLGEVKPAIEAAIRDCVDRGALTEVGGLETSRRKVDLLADRLRHAGSGTDAFYASTANNARWAESLHGSDLALFEAADSLLAIASKSARSDLARAIEPGLVALEETLNQRARTLQGLH